jgi:hypothetical protein
MHARRRESLLMFNSDCGESSKQAPSAERSLRGVLGDRVAARVQAHDK